MAKRKSVKLVSYKNAIKEVKKVYLNGLLQEEGEDYTLTSKGVKFTPSLDTKKPDLVTLETLKYITIV